MIHDATVEVTCDGHDCFADLSIEPALDCSGNEGAYDCASDAINEKVEAKGWKVDGEKHFCKDCR